MNKNWLVSIPTKLIFGNGTITSVGDEALLIGKKALLMTGSSSMERLGYVDIVVKSLGNCGIGVALFTGVESNPRIATVERAIQTVFDNRCDLVIGLGGGSVIDAAKAVASGAGLGTPVRDLIKNGMEKKGLHCIAIPTTSGTGAELTGISVLTDEKTNRKDALRGIFNFPSVAIVDPTLTLNLPPYITANTGMDALTHAIEAYTSKTASPVSNLFAREAIELVNSSLRKAVYSGNDLEAREKIVLASNLAGVAIALAGTGGAHGIGMSVGGLLDVDHGTVVGLSLPAVIRYNLPAALEKYKDVAELLGERTEGLALRDAAELAAVAVTRLLKDLNLPQTLSQIGVTRELLPVLVEDTKTQGAWNNNIVTTNAEDRKKLFELAF